MEDYNQTSNPYTFTPGHRGNTSSMEPLPFNVVTAVIYIVVFIVGILGNSLAIFVMLRYAKMKTVTNIFILNLALADELYILGIPFLGTNSSLSYWPYGNFFCKVCMTADAMSQFTSTFCLTAMSIDRYLAVVHPIRSANWRKPQVVKVFSAMIWIVSFLVVLPVSMYSHVQEELNTCNLSWPPPENTWAIAFILYTSILGFFAPLIVISICYLLIVIRVRSAGMRAGITKRRKSERKVTRMVIIIVLVFILCWLPFYVTNIVNLFYIIPEDNATAAVYFTLVILTYVNSCANPILYGMLTDKFRLRLETVLCLHRSKSLKQMDAKQAQTGPKENQGLVRNPKSNGQTTQSFHRVSAELIQNHEGEASEKEMNGQTWL
ncbi:somatostatin receptor type 5-like [Synchiropus splendidus]|uniref:somatostatin receptor type 5-like n=1 Tax=Synchiropus splendidus TaxID=270530 RepID=UPI00237DFB60|nr:somatostatin receptor type 5-like [Synchiropus splendidus]